ncbi:MAG: hypothetical protein ACI39F_09045, partial [Acutalibacteraceae bacterium]
MIIINKLEKTINYLGNIEFTKRGIAIFDDSGENTPLFKSDDLGLIQTAKTITPPEQKLLQFEISGIDGVLDFTDSEQGGAFFKNTTLNYTYVIDGKFSERKNLMSNIFNDIHGRDLCIIDCDNIDYFYQGRITANVSNKPGYSELTINCYCNPYRLKKPIEISVNADIYGVSGINLALDSGRKFVMPFFSSIKEHTVSFGGHDYVVPAGSENLSFADIVFSRGKNNITVIKTDCRDVAAYTYGDLEGCNDFDAVFEKYPTFEEMDGINYKKIFIFKHFYIIIYK